MKIKFCGIRREEDIDYLNQYSPDYAGFIFADSKRYVEPQQARKLIESLDKKIKTVGVFVNENVYKLVDIVKETNIDIIQLHGDETLYYVEIIKQLLNNEVWKAVRVKSKEDILNADKSEADILLLDSFSETQYGGTGKIANWDVIKNTSINHKYMLAGGLNSDNILEAIQKTKPFGVDISGGIELDGVKNLDKIKNIMNILRSDLNE